MVDKIASLKEEIKNINSEDKEEVVKRIQKLLSTSNSDVFQNTLLFVYGTLRQDQEGYKKIKALFGEESIISLFTTTLNWHKLYNLRTFPALARGMNGEIVTGECIYLSPEAYAYISSIEISEGFKKDWEMFYIPNDKGISSTSYRMYMFKAGSDLQKQINQNVIKYPRIEIGDWVRYQRQTEALEEVQDNPYALEQWTSWPWCD